MSGVSISVIVRIDVKAALIRGKVLRETESVTVEQEAMAEHWETFVGDLEQSNGSWKWGKISLTDTDPSLIYGWYQMQKIKADSARREAEEELSEIERIVTDGPFLDCPHYVDFSGTSPTYRRGTGAYQFSGYDRPITGWLNTRGATTRDDVLRADYYSRHSNLSDRNATELKVKNDAAFLAYLPIAKAAYDADCRERERLAAEKEAQEQAARLTRWAKRLESGYWEMETSPYNERRYGPYWCASVSFENGPKPIYSWGESTGKWGQAGILRVPCKPGDVIAWGQKDNRRPDKSDHYLMLMREDGGMTELTKAEAWQHWQEQHAVKA